ncbi:hypothetical protein [Streptacidiphilus sp. MAP5-3]
MPQITEIEVRYRAGYAYIDATVEDEDRDVWPRTERSAWCSGSEYAT